jgi:hypothetical protein
MPSRITLARSQVVLVTQFLLQTEERPPQRRAYLYTGPEELHTRHGFTRVRKIAKWRWVMRTKI